MDNTVKILLALDASTKAMDEAIRLAVERSASLVGLFVLDATWNDYIGHDWLSGSNARAGFLEYILDEEKRLAEATLHDFESRARAAGVKFETKTAAGNIVEQVLAELSEGYDLLVLGHPFKRGLEIVRDAAARLAKDTPCSMLLVT